MHIANLTVVDEIQSNDAGMVSLTQGQICAILESGVSNFENYSFRGVHFEADQVKRGLVFRHCHFNECSFETAQSLFFIDSVLLASSFADLESKEMHFLDSCLRDTDFDHAKLAEARFQTCYIDNARMENASFTGSAFLATYISISGKGPVDFSRTDWWSCRLETNTRQLAASFFHATFDHMNLTGNSDLIGADFRRTTLNSVQFDRSDLRSADFTESFMDHVQFGGANLSGAIGLPTGADYIRRHGEFDEKGLIVYKIFGDSYPSPDVWDIKPGSVITEVVNRDITVDCACGINVAITPDWFLRNYESLTVWRCRIDWIDLADVIVPLDSEGKIRCARLTLIELVTLKRDVHPTLWVHLTA